MIKSMKVEAKAKSMETDEWVEGDLYHDADNKLYWIATKLVDDDIEDARQESHSKYHFHANTEFVKVTGDTVCFKSEEVDAFNRPIYSNDIILPLKSNGINYIVIEDNPAKKVLFTDDCKFKISKLDENHEDESSDIVTLKEVIRTSKVFIIGNCFDIPVKEYLKDSREY